MIYIYIIRNLVSVTPRDHFMLMKKALLELGYSQDIVNQASDILKGKFVCANNGYED